MDWYPLWNSVRISLIACAAVFFAGILAAKRVAGLPPWLKGMIDVVLTLPLVLPPTVTGYFLLRLLGPRRLIGQWLLQSWGIRLTMTWHSAVFAAAAVSFPLMYRTARGAFESADWTILDSARTLGLSERYIFWRILLPMCRPNLIAGAVLSFARALGEYGATSMIAGYTPHRTATISTTLYQMWRTGNERAAMQWVGVSVLLSCAVLTAVNLFEKRQKRLSGAGRP